MKNILNYKLFEYRSGAKIKTRWTANDAIITLYYEKFGLHRLGITESEIEEFVNYNIGSTESSLKMQGLNVRYILSLNRGDKPEGLPDFSKAQIDAVKKYNKLSESELREVVKDILKKITDEEKLNNAIRAEKKRKEEEKLSQPIISSIPLGRYGNPMQPLKDVEKDISIPLKVGDIINHKKFGKGIVVDIVGNLIDIKFEKYSKSKQIIYDYDIFNWNKVEAEIEQPKLKQIPTKAPRMLIDTMKPNTIKRFKDFPVKPEFENPKNRFGKSMTKIEDSKKPIPVEIGDILNHNKFGIGEVVGIIDNKLEIKFNNEIKKILYKPEFFK